MLVGKHNIRSRSILQVTILVLFAGSLFTHSLHAQQNEESAFNLEEVTVTAQKRKQSIQDVPVSITAFDGQTMKELGFESSIDVAAQTPNLSTGQNFGEGNNPIVSIRGVTMLDFTEFNESPSAVYIDEFYKANLAGMDFQMFDMERVEVLRGPQGTLFGRNTTGGLVQYITVKPSQEKSGFGELMLGSKNQVRFQGAAGGGLSDNLSGRIAVLYSKHDGYVENTGYGDANDLDTRGIRGQLLYEPNDRLRFLTLVQYAKNKSNGNPYIHHSTMLDSNTGLAIDAPADFFGYRGPPLEERRTALTTRLELETRSTLGLFRIEYDAAAFTLISLTGFEKTDKVQHNDPDASPNDIFRTSTYPEGTEWSQEFRLQGSHERLRWLAGFYLFDYRNKGFQSADIPLTGVTPETHYSVRTSSWALFGQLEYDLTDNWSAIVGLRYTEEDKQFESINRFYSYPDGTFQFRAQEFTEETVGDLTRQTPDNTSYKALLNYTPSDDLLVYAGISTGFKGGTYNLGFLPLPSVDIIPVQPEEITSYEAGFKSSLPGGAARLNGAVFHYQYDNYQAYLFDGSTLSSFLFNNDASITGAELEFVVSPSDRWDLILGASWLDARLQDIPDRAMLVGGSPTVKNRSMPLAPEFTFNNVIRYHFDALQGHISLQFDSTWVGESYFDPLESPALKEPSHWEANLRATWTSRESGWYLMAFVENITDETFRSYSFDLTSAIGTLEDIVNKPRWWGVTVGYRW